MHNKNKDCLAIDGDLNINLLNRCVSRGSSQYLS